MSTYTNNSNNNVKVIEAESFNERLERMYSYFDKLPTFVERGKYSNHDPRNNIQAVITRPEGSYYVKEWTFGHNVVTNDGDRFYSKKVTGEAQDANIGNTHIQLANPTTQNPVLKTHTWDNFDSAVAGNGAAGTGAAITASIKAFATADSLYPRVDDPDGDNNASNKDRTITYRISYTTTDFNATGIKNGAIFGTGSPTTSTKLITHFQITSFDKTSSDTLKVYVNHFMSGV